MSRRDKIRTGIELLALRALPQQLRLGTVKAVDEEAQTCTVEVEEGYTLYDVRLTPVAGASVVPIPAVGSWALAAAIENDESFTYMVSASALDKLRAKIGDVTVEVTGDGVTLNGGDLGGLVKVNALVDDLNAIKRDLNNLKTVFQGWTPVAQDGGAALKTALTTAAWPTTKLETTKASDLEDDKIKH